MVRLPEKLISSEAGRRLGLILKNCSEWIEEDEPMKKKKKEDKTVDYHISEFKGKKSWEKEETVKQYWKIKTNDN